VFGDRLQIGRVIESVSDLQGEGQAPAGKCTVSDLHILNGRHNRSNGEVVGNKKKHRRRKTTWSRAARRINMGFCLGLLLLLYSTPQRPAFKMSSCALRWPCGGGGGVSALRFIGTASCGPSLYFHYNTSPLCHNLPVFFY